jgi:Raf kinase inhibitor-like YbhB/YbcL family protein
MQLRSDSFFPYDFADFRLAFSKPNGSGQSMFSQNRNPHLSWTGVPAGTQSFVLLAWDSDAPTVPGTVNQPNQTVPIDQQRADFFHWVLINLPANMTSIAEAVQAGVVPHGKAQVPSPYGGKQGLNDFTGWFAGDPGMAGDYAGYDGGSPPWNDERVHGYTLGIYALDVTELFPAGSRFFGPEVRDLMNGHVIGRSELHFQYTVRPPTAAGFKTRFLVSWP